MNFFPGKGVFLEPIFPRLSFWLGFFGPFFGGDAQFWDSNESEGIFFPGGFLGEE